MEGCSPFSFLRRRTVAKDKRLMAWLEWAMETEWKKDEKKPGVILYDGGKIEVSETHRDGVLLMHDALMELGKLFNKKGAGDG